MTIAEEEWREVSHLNADNCWRGGVESYKFPSKNFRFSCILRSIFDQNLIHCVTYFATYFPKTRARGVKGRSDNFIFCCRVFSSSSGSCQGHCYPVGLCWLLSCELPMWLLSLLFRFLSHLNNFPQNWHSLSSFMSPPLCLYLLWYSRMFLVQNFLSHSLQGWTNWLSSSLISKPVISYLCKVALCFSNTDGKSKLM